MAVAEIAPAWLTVQTAAMYSGLSEATVRGLLRRRELTKHVPIRGRILIRRAELDRFLLRGANGKSTRGRKMGGVNGD